MRRIPRPSRAIDPSASSLHSAVRPRLSPPSPPTHLGASTAAAFSSTPSNAFLLSGKQDKKKHQQFVRRWQKRLLGDSEPIGAHVDPYDPTSPVRIAPEEQGEYEEVLEEDGPRNANARTDVYGQVTVPPGSLARRNKAALARQNKYVPAEKGSSERPGHELLHVGGDKWLQQKLEREMAKEFEKLTMQTYTPLSLDMANDIETMTGTPYTLRDDNLMMAQTVHQVTNRPYTKYHFGLHSKPTSPEDMRRRFRQAMTEVYALREAGLDMDLAKLPNRGIYDVPHWVGDIKLHRTAAGDVVLAYPEDKSAEEFIQALQMAPEWESVTSAEEEMLINEAEELLVEEAEDLLEPVLPAEAVPVMDPATPVFKRAAVVKMDSEKKPFDFMSNRPVPRAKPVEVEKIEAAVEAVEQAPEPVSLVDSRVTELVSAFETSQSALNGLRLSILEHRAQRIADNIANMRSSTRRNKPTSPAVPTEEVKWRHVPLSDAATKFALFKRVFQLTGIRISDPHLTSCDTLGDMYDYLCAAAKPQPTSLYSAIYMQGQKARERAKKHGANTRRADLGDLIRLGNVELRSTPRTKVEMRQKKGMQKVVQYALWERGLSSIGTKQRKIVEGKNKINVSGGKRDVPLSARPVTKTTASFLEKKTMQERERDLAKQMQLGS